MRLTPLSYFRDLRRSRLAKNSLYNFAGLVAQSLLLLISTPLLVWRLGPEQYGLYMIASALLGTVGILEMGLGAGIVKFVAEYTSTQDRRGLSSIISGALIFYLAVGILFSVPIYYLGPKVILFLKMSPGLSGEGARAVRLVALGFLPMLLLNVGLAVPQGLQRYDLSNLVNFSRLFLSQVTAIVIVLLGGQIYAVLCGTVASLWICSLVSLVLALRLLRPHGLSFFLPGNTARRSLPFPASSYYRTSAPRSLARWTAWRWAGSWG